MKLAYRPLSFCLFTQLTFDPLCSAPWCPLYFDAINMYKFNPAILHYNPIQPLSCQASYDVTHFAPSTRDEMFKLIAQGRSRVAWTYWAYWMRVTDEWDAEGGEGVVPEEEIYLLPAVYGVWGSVVSSSIGSESQSPANFSHFRSTLCDF